jgi:hypothetical protein
VERRIGAPGVILGGYGAVVARLGRNRAADYDAGIVSSVEMSEIVRDIVAFLDDTERLRTSSEAVASTLRRRSPQAIAPTARAVHTREQAGRGASMI